MIKGLKKEIKHNGINLILTKTKLYKKDGTIQDIYVYVIKT